MLLKQVHRFIFIRNKEGYNLNYIQSYWMIGACVQVNSIGVTQTEQQPLESIAIPPPR